MIVYDLKCGGNHVFEAWFGSADDFEAQQQRGLVCCPICNVGTVERLPSLMAIGGKSADAREAGAREGDRTDGHMADVTAAMGGGSASLSPPPPSPAAGQPTDIETAKVMLQKMAKAQADAVAQSDYVGDKFADEARAMHYGEQDARPIYGETRPEDAKALREEGVPAIPLLFPVKQQSDA
ncbi:DUF1178 family protein [Pacificimonas sp. WHA3]|uniref:DUF1178 family protein n=1 Tax=Pacificimonas pallii TaxID=2827236 RepID=A0ABS6SHD1_9SPHN|nr:DUF1178 family protein [Pacificimonas pallii]MBV7257825.1 DUF1178 family protein [Pacificimonas pallii]